MQGGRSVLTARTGLTHGLAMGRGPVVDDLCCKGLTIQHVANRLEQPFLMEAMEGPGTSEGSHRLETVLHTLSYKIYYVIYTILILPVFISFCVYGHGQTNLENGWTRTQKLSGQRIRLARTSNAIKQPSAGLCCRHKLSDGCGWLYLHNAKHYSDIILGKPC